MIKKALKGQTYTNYLAKKLQKIHEIEGSSAPDPIQTVKTFVNKVSMGNHARKVEDTAGPYYGNIVKGFNRADDNLRKGSFEGHRFTPEDHIKWYRFHREKLTDGIMEDLKKPTTSNNPLNFKTRTDALSQAKDYASKNKINPKNNLPKPSKDWDTGATTRDTGATRATKDSNATGDSGSSNLGKALGIVGVGGLGALGIAGTAHYTKNKNSNSKEDINKKSRNKTANYLNKKMIKKATVQYLVKKAEDLGFLNKQIVAGYISKVPDNYKKKYEKYLL